MKILSIDTASNICGVSILEESNLICKLDSNLGTTHSENLMPMINSALEKANLSMENIELLVCDKGPGSFTGIRIGIATAKAFQDSLNIPCIGVSSLESLAYLANKEGFIFSLIDCKNNNCYFSLYENKNGNYFNIIPPSTDNIENAFNLCLKVIPNESCITFVGDGIFAFENKINEYFKNFKINLSKQNELDSYILGLIGFRKWKENELDDVLPLYLKKPQAQKILQEKIKEIEISHMQLTDLNSISNRLTIDFDEFWNASTLKDELESENSQYLVAKFKDEIVGFAGIKVMIDEADIMNIVVKKSCRNEGIGGFLLKSLIDLSKQLGLHTITLEVMEENYPAIYLYKEFGFTQVRN